MDDIMKLSCTKQSDPFCKDSRMLISGRTFVELLGEEKLHDTVRTVFAWDQYLHEIFIAVYSIFIGLLVYFMPPGTQKLQTHQFEQ